MASTGNTVLCSPIRAFLLVENRLLREALVRLFRKRGDLLVAGQSDQADVTAQDVLDSECEVVVIASTHTDWRPAGPGLGGAAKLGLKTILIGMDSDEEQFMAAVRSGVVGYLLKDASSSDVVATVRAVHRGEAVCPPQLCSTLFHFVAQTARESPAHGPSPRPDLTLRQQQLVALVAKGLTNKEIASRLNLSEFTVRNHVHRILKQVDAESRGEAVETIRAFGYQINP